MKYEKSDRIQYEDYCCPVHFMEDVLETLFDDGLDTDQVHIISDKELTEALLKIICQIQVEDFEFDLQVVDFDRLDDEVDEYMITILDDGEVFVEKAIDKNAKYFDCDGFMFVEAEVSEDAYSGNNRHNDVMVFEIEEF
jgi:hypothetical protein